MSDHASMPASQLTKPARAHSNMLEDITMADDIHTR